MNWQQHSVRWLFELKCRQDAFMDRHAGNIFKAAIVAFMGVLLWRFSA